MDKVQTEPMVYAFPIDFYDEEEGWTAESADLDLASCGDTKNEAFEAIGEAIALHIEVLTEDGELETVLAERDIKPALSPHSSQAKYQVLVSIPTRIQVSCSGTLVLHEADNTSWNPHQGEVGSFPEINHFVLA